MPVKSLAFLLFFGAFLFLQYVVLGRSRKGQNLLLVSGSYLFYAMFDWRMAPFLLLETSIFFWIGLRIPRIDDDAKAFRLLSAGVALGIGALVYFKYMNFLLGTAAELVGVFGTRPEWKGVQVVVPLGVSFFTFRLVSYVVDIFRCKLDPTTDFAAFAGYVCFFPSVVAGPIERPKPFLSQVAAARRFDRGLVSDGFRQFLWGMFKKSVVADNLASVVDSIWAEHLHLRGLVLVLGAGLYAIQMYMDFSGYSDMALGIGKAMGIRLAPNFRYPFFSTNVAEYWRGWHISLTSWLTDYVFLPLNVAFRNLGRFGLCAAIVINLVVVGAWHGANWTYVVFGLYHGLLFIPLVLSGAYSRKSQLVTGRLGLPGPATGARMLLTFALVSIGLVVFRADDLGQAFSYLRNMLAPGEGAATIWSSIHSRAELLVGSSFAAIAFVLEWIHRDREYGISFRDDRVPRPVRWACYYGMLAVVVVFSASGTAFIYAKF